jgi:phosphatidylglycerophosphatase C
MFPENQAVYLAENGTAARPLAVFDLDGTLLRRDSFLPFLVSYGLRRRRLGPLLALPFELLGYACRLVSDRTAKQRLLKRFFGSHSAADIRRHADWFNQSWVARHLNPVALARLHEHQRLGHRVVLLSASPALYVPVVGQFLGITEVVCTCVRVEGGVCGGEILGPNCKGDHKVAMLKEYLRMEAAPGESYAYGDSSSDLPILKWVRQGFLLSRGRFRQV